MKNQEYALGLDLNLLIPSNLIEMIIKTSNIDFSAVYTVLVHHLFTHAADIFILHCINSSGFGIEKQEVYKCTLSSNPTFSIFLNQVHVLYCTFILAITYFQRLS